MVSERNWWVAVVGAGPAGLYAAEALARRGATVDVFEEQFAPFGLVRYGVAPDHEKIKRTTRVFEKTLARAQVRLFANVELGRDVTVEELQEHYDQVLIATGSPGARDLGIVGEELAGTVTSTRFVNWYNGHPEHATDTYDLNTERAIVVGMGNVAIDVARILVKDPARLASTDITPRSLETLRESKIREVVVMARRGPNQAKFDLKELRELAALPNVEILVDGYESRRSTEQSDFIAGFPRVLDAPPSPRKRVVLHFCASPKALLGETKVRGVRFERNHLVESARSLKAVGSGVFSELAAGLVIAAIGYAGKPLANLPFCEETATIPHEHGRVLEFPDGPVVAGLYVAGWIKRGPTGLIGTNKACAQETVEVMEGDLDPIGPLRDPGDMVRLLRERNVRYLSYADWKTLDQHELKQGAVLGKARLKLLSREEALGVLSA